MRVNELPEQLRFIHGAHDWETGRDYMLRTVDSDPVSLYVPLDASYVNALLLKVMEPYLRFVRSFIDPKTHEVLSRYILDRNEDGSLAESEGNIEKRCEMLLLALLLQDNRRPQVILMNDYADCASTSILEIGAHDFDEGEYKTFCYRFLDSIYSAITEGSADTSGSKVYMQQVVDILRERVIGFNNWQNFEGTKKGVVMPAVDSVTEVFKDIPAELQSLGAHTIDDIADRLTYGLQERIEILQHGGVFDTWEKSRLH